MALPTIEIYSDIQCPWTYLAVYRLRTIWPEYAGRVRLVWRALSLEYINGQGTPKPTLDAETALIAQIEPALPLQRWSRPDWQWPVTCWPAFEALACAQAQGDAAGAAMSWAVRHAFFAESRSPALRHELLDIAREVAAQTALDVERFEQDWDSGRHKAGVIAESRRGWHELAVGGSPTFVLPDGRQVSGPASGEADIDEEHGVVRRYEPFVGDPLAVFRALLDTAAQGAG
ncbi:MAG TPA: DsbA family protein [Chloroflexota bacterium]|nr:DsbA family protein [Chloroflexota bacterium]